MADYQPPKKIKSYFKKIHQTLLTEKALTAKKILHLQFKFEANPSVFTHEVINQRPKVDRWMMKVYGKTLPLLCGGCKNPNTVMRIMRIKTRIPRNAVSRLPALFHIIEVNL